MSRLVRLQLIAVVATICLVLLLTTQAQANPLDITSATEIEAESSSTTLAPPTKTNPSTCPHMGACGWGVYSQNKNKIKYFIRNTCRCSSEYGCLLDDEDLSLSAFIYRCKERKTIPA